MDPRQKLVRSQPQALPTTGSAFTSVDLNPNLRGLPTTGSANHRLCQPQALPTTGSANLNPNLRGLPTTPTTWTPHPPPGYRNHHLDKRSHDLNTTTSNNNSSCSSNYSSSCSSNNNNSSSGGSSQLGPVVKSILTALPALPPSVIISAILPPGCLARPHGNNSG